MNPYCQTIDYVLCQGSRKSSDFVEKEVQKALRAAGVNVPVSGRTRAVDRWLCLTHVGVWGFGSSSMEFNLPRVLGPHTRKPKTLNHP